ncbi:pentatricopeptide repeat-containing protein At3g20730 [Nymphaea colorata]|uniref:Pentacotripeptide-repeat region of PRORP domain-containing protein n=1 Tax=Nymphaea colorata TaxID=210225 RepID=A0A5K1F2C5_9MAGN|nr:pentatricopeptide repeat-containing protein At3g20730 [Nymphaea colorata]XP_031490780.1 pentatricopeptide repeat-containing protein At3g20730 [Nymphaea colorata]XP_031490781.1 pentatricopeptide repeat-containing protein At3g20730 [Nymphaea colorata]XP_049934556.1 pentatricopeptide repeat-containing protein At3g20730 [Nymphaea colorata]XP_049934557.1 pentatricopeptide repeat-containing protein At3g20730 [Nymphaea colorata]XP_049934558.1 pentatricopeptide repeat-containing protein At3g20730 [
MRGHPSSFCKRLLHSKGWIPTKNFSRSNVNLLTKLSISDRRNGDAKSVREAFDEVPRRDVIAWSALISRYSRQGHSREAVNEFVLMNRRGVDANQFTYGSVLRACTHLDFLQEGEMVHCCIMKRGYYQNLFVQSALVDLHLKCGRVEDALYVFDKMSERDLVSWNTMVGGFAAKGFGAGAVQLFQLMLREGFCPDRYSFASVLKRGCSHGIEGVRVIHGLTIKFGCDSNDIVCGALIDAYAKSGSLGDAKLVYHSMEVEDLVSLTALVTGYVHGRKNGVVAMEMFSDIHRRGMRIDGILLCSVLSICADVAAFDMGRQIHALLWKIQSNHDTALANALVDMYSKCGAIEDADQVFNEMAERNVISWTCLITGYGKNGLENEAIGLFQRMERSGIKPNDVTFLGVLCACSHGGMASIGQQLFDSMMNAYGIQPREEHYACVVDLLARSGCIKEAYEFVCNMPIRPTASLWGSLLGACILHQDAVVGEKASRHLIAMEPANSTSYIVVANIYKSLGLWEKAEEARRLMKERGLSKEPGWSLSYLVKEPRFLEQLV